MNALIKKRDSIKRKLTSFANFVSSVQQQDAVTDLSIIQLQERLSKNLNLIDQFDDVQIQIEALANETQMQEQEQQREEFEDIFYTNIALAKSISKQSDSIEPSSSNQVNSSSNSQEQRLQVKLPTIKLPDFNGQFDQWLPFRETYTSLIHDQSSINDLQKFHYLKASLAGDALKVIESISLSSSNYKIAWDTLLDRYNNDRLLVFNHVKSLVHLEPIVKESAEKLRVLIDNVSKNLRALEQLDQPVSHWDTLIVFFITTKLDANTLRAWEEQRSTEKIATFAELKAFLKTRADGLDTIKASQTMHDKHSGNSHLNKHKFNQNFLVTDTEMHQNQKCPICNEDHLIHTCKQFLEQDINARYQILKRKHMCTNCLRKGHMAYNCRGSNCRVCHKRHNTLLHFNKEISRNRQDLNTSSNSNGHANGDAPSEAINLSAHSSNNDNHMVLLSTAQVYALSKHNKHIECRALLDNGSQSNFITREFVKKLNLSSSKINFNVVGINSDSLKIAFKTKTKIKSMHSDYEKVIEFLIIDQISGNIPQRSIDIAKYKTPNHINLADPYFHKSQKIDLLLGADVFWDVLLPESLSNIHHNMRLQNSLLGWIVSGKVEIKNHNTFQIQVQIRF